MLWSQISGYDYIYAYIDDSHVKWWKKGKTKLFKAAIFRFKSFKVDILVLEVHILSNWMISLVWFAGNAWHFSISRDLSNSLIF